MHSLANLVACTNLNFLLPKDEKKCWKIFVIFLSKVTFEPDTPGSSKRGKRAKWFVPRKFWPGVAPCSGHFRKLGRNWQRQKGAFWVVEMKKAFFLAKTCSNSIIDLSAHSPWIAQQNSAPYWMR